MKYRNIRRLLEKVRSQGSFANHLSIAIGGGSVSYGIGFLLTPIISRLYLPEDYGVFALFNSIVLNASMFCSLGYNSALLLPRGRKEFSNLMSLVSLLLFSVSGIFFILLLVFKEPFFLFLQAESLARYWYLLPLMILATHFVNILQSVNVRFKDFKTDANSKIVSTVISKVFAIGYAFVLTPSFFGLLLAEVVLRLVQSLLLMGKKRLVRSAAIVAKVNGKDLLKVAKSYQSYPAFFMPSNWLSIMITQLPLYIIASSYGEQITGHFSFAVSILNLPLMVVGFSASQVLFRKVIEIKDEPSLVVSICRKFLLFLIIISIVPFAAIGIAGEEIYSLLLGSNWSLAGQLARYLSVHFFFQFITFPFLSIFRVLRKEKMLMFVNFGSLAVLAILLWNIKDLPVTSFVMVYVGLGSLINIVIALVVIRLIKRMNSV